MPSPEPTTPSQRLLTWGRVELVLLLLAGLGGLVFQLTLPLRQAADDDYRKVAEVLKREAQPGDVVLLSPWWAERARLFLPEGLPVVGYLHSEQDPLLEHYRIWVLSEPHLPRHGTAAFERAFLPGRKLELEAREFGNLSLALYRNERIKQSLAWGAEQLFEDAAAYLENPDGSREPCTREASTFQCPRGLHVAMEWHELFYEPRRCLWMHPPGGPTRLVLESNRLGLNRIDSVLLEAGIIWELAVRTEVTPLHVGMDDATTGASLASITIPGGVEGMQKQTVPIARGLRRFKVWTQSDNPDSRDACVDLHAFDCCGGGND